MRKALASGAYVLDGAEARAPGLTKSREGANPVPSVSLFGLLDWLYGSEDGRRASEGLRQKLEAKAVRFRFEKSHRWDPTFEDAVAQELGRMIEREDGYLVQPGERFVSSEAQRGRAPAAIVTVLSALADDTGQVSMTSVDRRFGADAASLIAEAAQANEANERAQPPDRTARDGAQSALRTASLLRNPRGRWSCFVDQDVVKKVAATAYRDLGDRMRALTWVQRTFGEGQPLAKIRVLAIQHLFPSTVPLLEAMIAAGCRKIQVLGKPYSTDPDVARFLAAPGVEVQESASEGEIALLANGLGANPFIEESCPFPGGVTGLPRETFIREWLARQLRELPEDERLLLLDDGGYLVALLHEHFPEQAHRVIAIEQTQNGINRIEAIRTRLQADGRDIGCAVVDVARHPVKKLVESPIIGESVADSIDAWLDAIFDAPDDRVKEAALLGGGAAGRQVAVALMRRGYRVFVHDVDPTALKEAAALGCVACTDKKDALRHGHLLVSCAGAVDGEILSLADYEDLPDGAVVANAASGNREVSTHLDAFWLSASRGVQDAHHRLTADFCGERVTLGDADGADETRTHVIHRSENGKSALVLCSGHVINMAEDAPPEYIQLTRALLLLAVFQAASMSASASALGAPVKPGFEPLLAEGADGVVRETEAALAELGLSLLEPRFETLRRATAGTRKKAPATSPFSARAPRTPMPRTRAPRSVSKILNEARKAAAFYQTNLLRGGAHALSEPQEILRFVRVWMRVAAPEYASHRAQITDLDHVVQNRLLEAGRGADVLKPLNPSELAWAQAWVRESNERVARRLDEILGPQFTGWSDASARGMMAALRHASEIRAFAERYVKDNEAFGLENLRYAVREARRDGYSRQAHDGASTQFRWIHPGTASLWLDAIRALGERCRASNLVSPPPQTQSARPSKPDEPSMTLSVAHPTLEAASAAVVEWLRSNHRSELRHFSEGRRVFRTLAPGVVAVETGGARDTDDHVVIVVKRDASGKSSVTRVHENARLREIRFPSPSLFLEIQLSPGSVCTRTHFALLSSSGELDWRTLERTGPVISISRHEGVLAVEWKDLGQTPHTDLYDDRTGSLIRSTFDRAKAGGVDSSMAESLSLRAPKAALNRDEVVETVYAKCFLAQRLRFLKGVPANLGRISGEQQKACLREAARLRSAGDEDHIVRLKGGLRLGERGDSIFEQHPVLIEVETTNEHESWHASETVLASSDARVLQRFPNGNILASLENGDVLVRCCDSLGGERLGDGETAFFLVSARGDVRRLLSVAGPGVRTFFADQMIVVRHLDSSRDQHLAYARLSAPVSLGYAEE
ncbi:MAG: hypothetical protein H6729_12390 [Deltaproteobacteria bacterium]|nr:hypothetical protein [Deltaproteobacteria bacterium]